MLLGLLRADAGAIRLLGRDPWRDAVSLHRRIPYVSGDVTLWPNLRYSKGNRQRVLGQPATVLRLTLAGLAFVPALAVLAAVAAVAVALRQPWIQWAAVAFVVLSLHLGALLRLPQWLTDVTGTPSRMQTFLPVPGFTDSALTLDVRRLGKQRVETIQVLRALTVPGYGWRRHPAAAMWAGYEEALVRYGLDVCQVWCEQGRADTCATTLLADLRTATGIARVRTVEQLQAACEVPPWIGDTAVHLSHQSALLRKDPEHYRPLFPGAVDDLPYVWPVSDRPRRVPVD